MFISSEGMWSLWKSSTHGKPKWVSLPVHSLKRSISLSFYLYIYACCPFLILLSQLPLNPCFFLSASAVTPLALSCQSNMWAPHSCCQLFSCGSWTAQGHLNILLVLLALQGVTALPGLAYLTLSGLGWEVALGIKTQFFKSWQV